MWGIGDDAVNIIINKKANDLIIKKGGNLIIKTANVSCG
jgi:hypothetical protein